jgi:hypothetical protein
MKNEIVPATLEHAEALAPRLRQADRDEIKAAAGESADIALTMSVAGSIMAWAWLVDGEPVAIFGVAASPHKAMTGIPWFLAAPEFETQKVYFLRNCGVYIDEMHDYFPILENVVDCRNTTSIQWLAWAGFAMCEVYPFYGVQRMPFIRFAKVRES